jgi:hypothetical protein|tara:strand:+ start:319 stop:444 length:126 start_codon:yes stop_codon:yes gene_type:complete
MGVTDGLKPDGQTTTWWLEEGDINKTSSPPPVLFKIIKESA